jgi:hypothetical protein
LEHERERGTRRRLSVTVSTDVRTIDLPVAAVQQQQGGSASRRGSSSAHGGASHQQHVVSRRTSSSSSSAPQQLGQHVVVEVPTVSAVSITDSIPSDEDDAAQHLAVKSAATVEATSAEEGDYSQSKLSRRRSLTRSWQAPNDLLKNLPPELQRLPSVSASRPEHDHDHDPARTDHILADTGIQPTKGSVSTVAVTLPST